MRVLRRGCTARRADIGDVDALTATTEAIHEAGLVPERWPDALASISRLLDARFATLEVLDRASFEHLSFQASQLPPGNMDAYLGHYAAINPRALHARQRPEGTFLYDSMVLDERSMDRDPFYQEFLAVDDLRYFFSGLVRRDRKTQTIVSVQRTLRQGHAKQDDLDRLRLLLPHVGRMIDLTTRLRQAESRNASLGATLDWLSDAVVVIAKDGGLVYVNSAFERMAAAEDGIGFGNGVLSILDTGANAALARALGAIRRQREDPSAPVETPDFLVRRPSAKAAYRATVRALPPSAPELLATTTEPMAVVFFRDPAEMAGTLSRAIHRDIGLTDAEGRLADALCRGMAPNDYADVSGLSRNTVYTHLRRLKEKLGCDRTTELVRRLSALQMPIVEQK